MNKKITYAILIFICVISLFLNLYKKNQSPVCFDADEAAFGYNAYSILQTGKDEYGTMLPLRLKSFGDYKLPLYSYLSIPFVGTMGLSETSTRALNDFLALLFPLVIFFLAKELFKKDSIALLSAMLVATSLGLHTIGRQAHEAYLASILISGAAYFLLKTIRQPTLTNSLLFAFVSLLSLFAYQSSRLFVLFFILYLGVSAFFTWRRKEKVENNWALIFVVIAFLLFSITDIIYQPSRVKNLLFFNNIGFSLKIDQLRGEGGNRLLYNKVTTGVKDLTGEYLKYFSPQFLITQGDENLRFGYDDMSLVTPIEYLFFFVGLYFLFKKKERYRYFILSLLLVSPLAASLTWAGLSITRSLFLLVPFLVIGGYGITEVVFALKKHQLLVLCLLIIGEVFFLSYSWDFYLNHYPKRADTIVAWQCGYKEMGSYVKNNYNNFDQFNITKKAGQPYIFLLFYLNYSPQKYQQQAVLSAPDQYGFGQVAQFDKFKFDFHYDPSVTHVSYVGYPDDFGATGIDPRALHEITVGPEKIFQIYEAR